MKLMKKLTVLLLAVMMTCSMAVTAFAAGSPSGTNSGVELRFKDSFDNAEDQAAADAAKADPASALKAAGLSGDYTLVTIVDAYVVDTATEKAITPYSGTISGTLQVADVKASDKIVVLHYLNGAWVQETATAGNGSVSMTLKGCSPVAIYKSASASGSTSAGTASPATGEAPMTAAAAVLVVAAIGMVFCRKKAARS